MQSEQAVPCPKNPGQGDMKHLKHTVMGLFLGPGLAWYTEFMSILWLINWSYNQVQEICETTYSQWKDIQSVVSQIRQSVKRQTEAFRNLVFRQKLYKKQKNTL